MPAWPRETHFPGDRETLRNIQASETNYVELDFRQRETNKEFLGPLLIFRKQIFQIRRRQAAGKSFFTEDIGNGLRLALLQFPDFFLDGAGRDQAVGIHGLRLANTM
jgi:hypothetical protein